MSEQANGKSTAAYTMTMDVDNLLPLHIPYPLKQSSEIAMVSMLTIAIPDIRL